jgi:hypothetical protein
VTQVRAGAGHQDDDLGFAAIEEAGGHRGVPGVGDLRLDGAGRPRELRRGPGNGDHRGAGGGEGGGDPVAEAAARADDDRGPAGQVTHGLLHGSWSTMQPGAAVSTVAIASR